MRIHGKFITYEGAVQLMNDKKRLKEMNLQRKVVKKIISEYEFSKKVKKK